MKKLLTILASSALATGLYAVDFLKFESGKALSVVNTEQMQKVLKDDKKQYDLELYDRSTGVLIGNVEGAKQYKIGKLDDYPLGQVLYNKEQELAATILGVERRKDERVLSFAYLLINKGSDKLDSGCLLFDKQGKAVAFYYADHSDKKSLGYIVPVQAVQRAYKDYTINNTISRAWAGIIVSPTGTIPEIISIRPDSPAEKAGIKVGDIITKVGDHKVYSYLESVNAFYYLIPNVPVKFQTLRDGQEQIMEVTPVSRQSLTQTAKKLSDK